MRTYTPKPVTISPPICALVVFGLLAVGALAGVWLAVFFAFIL